ncbi:MAG: prolyl oligopeptidase family serine peptidase [Bacteroidales bacterium]
MKTRTLIAVFLLLPFLAEAQNVFAAADRFCADSLYKLIRNSSVSVTWTDKKSSAFYYYLENGENRDWFIVDTKKWTRKQLIDNEKFAGQLTAFGIKTSPEKIYLYDLTFDKLKSFTFQKGDRAFRYEIAGGLLTELKAPAKETAKQMFSEKDYWKCFSADSLYYVSAIGHDIYLFSAQGKDSVRLTFDGEKYNSYSLSGDSENRNFSPETHCSTFGRWIGKSHSFLTFKDDKREVGTLSLVNNLDRPRPTVTTYKFPMPGDKNVVQRNVYMIKADSAKIIKLNTDKFKDQKIEIPRFGNFVQTEDKAWFIRRNRQCDTVELCRVDASTGKVKTIISENCSPRLNEQLFEYHIINEGKEILWWSERSGKGHIYLYDGEGRLLGDVSRKDMVAGHIVKIDTAGRKVIFEGFGGEKGINPHYRFFYAASLDGKEATLLTPGDGWHNCEFSPDGRFIFDTFSRMDNAKQFQICDNGGHVKFTIGKADVSAMRAAGWEYPKVVQVTGADGKTPLYGVVYLPFNMKETEKYPIISNVYPGPHTDLVPQEFVLDDNANQSLAQLGFIVINFSYRGSCPYRGHDYYDFSEGNLRDYAIADDMAAIREVAKTYPYADTTRIGIYGHSGGGFMTVAAMLGHPEFYKVGVAASGNHDNNIYTQWWGETFHGGKWVTDKNGETVFECRIPTNIEIADRLEGRLMLITGDMDNNVHPASTLRLADALIKAGKRFDMMVFPGVDHGIGGTYYENTIRCYFLEHLKNTKVEDIDIVKP